MAITTKKNNVKLTPNVNTTSTKAPNEPNLSAAFRKDEGRIRRLCKEATDMMAYGVLIGELSAKYKGLNKDEHSACAIWFQEGQADRDKAEKERLAAIPDGSWVSATIIPGGNVRLSVKGMWATTIRPHVLQALLDDGQDDARAILKEALATYDSPEGKAVRDANNPRLKGKGK